VEEPGLFSALVVPEDLLAATSGAAWVAAMVEVEVAYLGALADCGQAPPAAAQALAAWWADPDRPGWDLFDPVRLGRLGANAANPVVPLVAALRRACPGAADWLHRGATSQDVLDSALVLVAHRAGRLVRQRLAALAVGLAEWARHGQEVLLVGRTLLQPALPTTWAWKAAGWLDGVHQADEWLREALGATGVQLGGAVGTLAALGTEGPRVLDAFASRLGLPAPPVPWHGARQRPARLAAALAGVAGTAAKVAGDLALLQQAEVGEITDRAGPGPGPAPDRPGLDRVGSAQPEEARRGGSSAMPQKRNPVDAVAARVAATRAAALVPVVLASLPGEQERAAGAWQAEWAALAELLGLAGAAAEHAASAVAHAEPQPAAMARHLDAGGAGLLAEGVTLALQARLGRERAAAAMARALGKAPADPPDGPPADRCREPGREPGRDPVAEALAADPEVTEVLGPEELRALLDPRRALGSAATWVARVLDRQATWPWPAPPDPPAEDRGAGQDETGQDEEVLQARPVDRPSREEPEDP
jgi:3-carboxy-cis,cis-muconate cycloisomerase